MKIVSFIVCDDIRNEAGGKHSIMGVYGNSIEFRGTPEKKNQWPKIMRIGIFANLKLAAVDREKDIISLRLHVECNGKAEKVAEGIFRAEDIPISHSVNLAIVHSNFVFREAGEVTFFFDFLDGKDNVIEKIVPDYALKISEKALHQPLDYGSRNTA